MGSLSTESIVRPICIILVKNGSKGDRLLFRYPYASTNHPLVDEIDPLGGGIRGGTSNPLSVTVGGRSNSFSNRGPRNAVGIPDHDTASMDPLGDETTVRTRKISKASGMRTRSGSDAKNPYAVGNFPFGEDAYCVTNAPKVHRGKEVDLRSYNAVLGELSDKDLSNLLAVNSELSEKKFELKTNEVRFVGHPTQMYNPKDRRPINPAYTTSVKLFHIVFCLQARASHSIVKCYYDLSKRLGIGLRHEEYRCGYLSNQMKEIIMKHDEACTDQTDDLLEQIKARETLFSDILSSSSLAKLLKRVYDDVCASGFIRLKINNWVQISFCLPQMIHNLPYRSKTALVEPENIHKCLEAIRPYHAILLLVSREDLVGSFWVDSSSTIPRMLQVYSPIKSLQTLAADADLTLSQVVEIASHLVYWAAAMVIYPICETNVYVIAPDAPVTSPELMSSFTNSFPDLVYSQTISEFSSPLPLSERYNPLRGGTSSQLQLIQLISWMLQNRLLIQLHTYILLSTYLDTGSSENAMGKLSETVDDDGSLKLSFQVNEEDDDATFSDTVSETILEEPRAAGHSPVQMVSAEQEIINLVNNVSFPPRMSQAVAASGDSLPGSKLREREPSGDTDRDVMDETSRERWVKYKEILSDLNENAKRAIAKVKNPFTVQDIRMFSRLTKYFTGEYHIEEIMYRENVRRSQLMLLFDKFRDVLVTVEMEDDAINFFKQP